MSMTQLTAESQASNEAFLAQIKGEIAKILAPRISDKRQDEIQGLLKTTVNGDAIVSYLVIDATLGKDNKKGIIVYVLTNIRLIKLDTDEKETQSVSYPLSTLIGIERKLVDGRAEVQVSFQNSSFGLRYSANNQNIVKFFQMVDQPKGSATNG